MQETLVIKYYSHLYFKKTLDAVNHSILIVKLSHYRVGCVANDWIKYLLYDRIQYTTANDIDLDLFLIYYGVSQGSVLESILLLILLN